MIRALAALCCVAIFAGASSTARASSGGIAGSSGKSGSACEACHTGNGHAPLPTVTFKGPAMLAPGATGMFEIDIVSSASLQSHGIDVAASAGTLGVVTQTVQTHLDAGEVVQSAPATGSAMSAWKFSYTAPTTAGAVTLFGAGLSGNGDSGTFGDTSAKTTLQVQVAATVDMAVPPPDLAVPPPDLFGIDLIGADLTVPPDFAMPDLAPPPPDEAAPLDLAALADSAPAAGGDMIKPPPKNEARWACDCRLAAHPQKTNPQGLTLAALALLAMAVAGARIRSRRERVRRETPR